MLNSGVAKNRPRTPATREQIQQARARTAPQPPDADTAATSPEPATSEPDNQPRLWQDHQPQQQRHPLPTQPRSEREPARREPQARYERIVTQLDLVTHKHQAFLDAKAAVQTARDDWLDIADEAFRNGVMAQDIAKACGMTRSGLYQALNTRRHERDQSDR